MATPSRLLELNPAAAPGLQRLPCRLRLAQSQVPRHVPIIPQKMYLPDEYPELCRVQNTLDMLFYL